MVFTVAVRFFAVPVYLSQLGPEAVGLISLYASIQALLVFFDFGLASAFNREIAHLSTDNKEEIASLGLALERFYPVVALGLGVLICTMGGMFGALWLKSEVVSSDEIATVFVLYGAIFAFTWTGQLYQQGISGLQEFGSLNKIRAWGVVLDVGGSMLVAYSVQLTSAYFVWQLCAAGIVTALYRRKFWQLAGNPNALTAGWWTRIRALLRVSLGLNAYAVLSMAFMQIDRVFISRFCSLADVGRYGMATTFPMAMLYLVYPITSASYPYFSSLAAREVDQQALFERFGNGAKIITIILLLATAIFSLNAELVITTWLRDEETSFAVAALSRILILGSFVQGVVALPIILLMALRQAWRASLAFGAGLVCYTATLGAIVPQLGTLGAAMSWLFANLVILVFITYALKAVAPPLAFSGWLRQNMGMPTATGLTLLLALQLGVDGAAQVGVALPALELIGCVLLVAIIIATAGRASIHNWWLACRRPPEPTTRI